MNNELTSELITDESIIIDYIDDYLYDRLKNDNTINVNDFIAGGEHIAIKNNHKIVGIISFGIKNGYAMIHPKIRKEHMIYAKRGCVIALNYLSEMGCNLVYAKIPIIFKSNKKMAYSCGMEYVRTVYNEKPINGVLVDVEIYKKVL